MSNLVDIQLQIEKLQKQASTIKAKEFQKTVVEIREKMHAFGITAKDLQAPKGTKITTTPARKNVKAAARKYAATRVAAKYRGPEGQTWSGRGLTPRWLKSLMDQGHQKQEFAITT